MYALIWKSRFSQSNTYEIRVFETIELALDEVEYQRLERRAYGISWWIAEPMKRQEDFVGALGTYRTIYPVAEEQQQEDDE